MTGRKKSKVCRVPGCRRPSRALGVCQTHYKHLKKFGRARPIRLRRKGRLGTVKFAGLSLSAACVEAIKEVAAREGRSANAVITDIVERWVRRRFRPGRPLAGR